jgi:recombinational DNA repair ATPase RecF
VQTIPFRPITLIYGPNGSGKSSIVEGIRWLRTLALSKSSSGFNRLVRHHDKTGAIQAGVPIELDAAEYENDPTDYFARLARQIRSVSVDLRFGSKRTTVAQAFAMFRLGDTPHIQYLELIWS